ncbi:RNA-binding protein RO60-like isoform X1 [Lampetra planeri]
MDPARSSCPVSWGVSGLTRLRRFLCFGSEGTVYRARVDPPTKEHAQALLLLHLVESGQGEAAVREIVSAAAVGSPVNADATALALAVCSSCAGPDGAEETVAANPADQPAPNAGTEEATPGWGEGGAGAAGERSREDREPGPAERTRRAAFAALPDVCRTPAQLFLFVKCRDEIAKGRAGGGGGRGAVGRWGRAQRRAVSRWYHGQTGRSLVGAVTACRARCGYAHRDLLRLAHVKPSTPAVQLVAKYVTRGWKATREAYAHVASADSDRCPPGVDDGCEKVADGAGGGGGSGARAQRRRQLEEEREKEEREDGGGERPSAGLGPAAVAGDGAWAPGHGHEELRAMLRYLSAVERVRRASDCGEVEVLVAEHGLVWQHLLTQHLKSPQVWMALLKEMPVSAMLRSLGKMAALDLLAPESAGAALVCQRLAETDELREARVHPLHVLVALRTYERGQAGTGRLKWRPNPAVLQALDATFYSSMQVVQPTGKRFLLAVDVSISMCGGVLGTPVLMAKTLAAALSLVIVSTERSATVLAFSQTLLPLPIDPSLRLDQVLRIMDQVPRGATDCAQLLAWARDTGTPVDVFLVLTDSKAAWGAVHPTAALQEYRKETGLASRLVVCTLTRDVAVAAGDADDAGVLHVCGFDAAALDVINAFACGRF